MLFFIVKDSNKVNFSSIYIVKSFWSKESWRSPKNILILYKTFQPLSSIQIQTQITQYVSQPLYIHVPIYQITQRVSQIGMMLYMHIMFYRWDVLNAYIYKTYKTCYTGYYALTIYTTFYTRIIPYKIRLRLRSRLCILRCEVKEEFRKYKFCEEYNKFGFW